MTKKKIVVIFAISIALLISFIGGQSFAKYIGQVQGKGSAEIANWSFKVNNNSEEIQTIKLDSTINNSTLINNKIAPGTSGNFNITIDGSDSDVGIDYEIQFKNETTKPQNLKFEYNNQVYNSISDLNEKIKGTINADDKNKKINVNIKWKWEYETGSDATQIKSNDLIDTNNSKQIRNYEFNVIVTGSQVMPEKS